MNWRTAGRSFFLSRTSKDPVSDQKVKYSPSLANERPGLTFRDSILRVVLDHREQSRLIPRTRGRSNVRSKKLPAYGEYLFFLICDLPWLQLVMLTTGLLFIFILVFASMFYLSGGVSHEKLEEEDLSFWTYFCFSFQTMDQIGFGTLAPVSFSCDLCVTLTSLMASFFWKFSGGIIFVKLSLPKKLKYLNKFSNVAVRNRNQLTFQGHGYHLGEESLSFRIAGTFSSSSICDSEFHLIYFRSKTDGMGYENYELQECDFEINRQLGRTRELIFSAPLLGLPWTVTHPIDRNSPLWGLSLEEMEKENGEMIGIVVGIDEISSLTYQSRWSYKASEILEGHEFIPCVRRDRENGFFNVDFKRLSKTRLLEPSPSDITIDTKSNFWKIQGRIRRTLSVTTTKIKRKLVRSLTSLHIPDMSPTRTSFPARSISLYSDKSHRNSFSSFSCGSSPIHGIEEIFLDLRKRDLGKKHNVVEDKGFESPRTSLLSSHHSSACSSGSGNPSDSK